MTPILEIRGDACPIGKIKVKQNLACHSRYASMQTSIFNSAFLMIGKYLSNLQTASLTQLNLLHMKEFKDNISSNLGYN